MKQLQSDTLQDIYGRIYDFVDTDGDAPLDLMDKRLAESDLTDAFNCWLDDETLTDDEVTALIACLEEVADECRFEFGEFEDDED